MIKTILHGKERTGQKVELSAHEHVKRNLSYLMFYAFSAYQHYAA